jgi:5-methylcytosine-specific restriction endonuclease McrA
MLIRQRRPRLRLDPELYAALRQRVLQRDGWRCQRCGSLQNLEAHHGCTLSNAPTSLSSTGSSVNSVGTFAQLNAEFPFELWTEYTHLCYDSDSMGYATEEVNRKQLVKELE